MGRTNKALATGAAFLFAALLVGCGDEKVVTRPAPQAIKVAVQATPESLDCGGAVTVRAVVEPGTYGTLTYSWSSPGGSFASPKSESTVWNAPEQPGVYNLCVVVSDGKDVAIAGRNVGVATYLPSETPFYRGATYCATCHDGGPGGDQFTTWKTSPHAGAYASLASIGMGGSASCLPCHTVGSMGVNADPNKDNGGYDETAVERLQGVQCENCHGPASEHPNPDMYSVAKTMDPALCGGCHTDDHHPTYDEWQTSLHSQVEYADALRAGCAKCHNGFTSVEYLDDPMGFTTPAANPDTATAVTCAVCHDPHGNSNPYSLRNASVSNAIIPGATSTSPTIITQGGLGRLCMDCHNGRRSQADADGQITNGTAHFGPHHAVQGDMLVGVNAYQKVNPTFPWTSSKHLLIENSCVTCHVSSHEGDPENGVPNFTGHTFEPEREACAPCHGTLNSFTDVIAKQDFDGNGQIQGVQIEVQGLLNILERTIIAHARARDLASGDALAADFEGQLGVKTVTSEDERKAGYNWAFVSFDGSRGVHNANYAIQLLQQSILFLDPSQLPSKAFILERADY